MNFNFKNIKQKIVASRELIMIIFLWLCIWGTYNTDISRILNSGFPNSFFDLVHGLRSFLPFITIIYSVVVLFKNRNYFKDLFYSPVGLFIVYSLLGIVSSIFSRQPLMAVYWGVLYLGVLIFLLIFINNKEILKKIIVINFFIAGFITLTLFILFLSHPGVLNSLTYNFLICKDRPYEGMGGLYAESNLIDMAGTRPTGLARYAGITTIVCLGFFIFARKKFKINWFLIFTFFLVILLFSKGKAGMVALIISIIFLIWATKKINILSILGTIFIIIISGIIIFYNVPCTNKSIFIDKIAGIVNEQKIQPQPPVKPNIILEDNKTEEINIPKITSRTSSVITLSGRTGGVWADSWNLFLKNPVFGYGFQADRYFLNGQHAHNTIIHALLQAGILGTMSFVLAFILLLICLMGLFRSNDVSEKEKQFLIIITAVLIFFIVRGFTESLVYFSADWLFLVPIIAYIQCLYNEKNISKKNNKQVLEFRGSKIDIIKMSEILQIIENWIKNEKQKLHWIIVTGMHGVAEANKNIEFKKILSFANLWVPDGISLVWLARIKGHKIKERISGADLMKEFFKLSEKENFKHYFYGDTQETLNLLSKKIKENFPRLKVVGYFSPPFKNLSEKEENENIEKINNAKPDVLWVGLGLPKQEKWIYKNREKLKVPVVIGVGAAFKFLSGSVKRAPKWVGDMGLEWLWRLVFEFKITWKRVFIAGPYFLLLVFLDLIYIKNYK